MGQVDRRWSPDCPRLARALAGLYGPIAGLRARGLAGPQFAGPRVFRSAFYRVYLNGKVITLDHFEHISPGETLGSLWS